MNTTSASTDRCDLSLTLPGPHLLPGRVTLTQPWWSKENTRDNDNKYNDNEDSQNNDNGPHLLPARVTLTQFMWRSNVKTQNNDNKDTDNRDNKNEYNDSEDNDNGPYLLPGTAALTQLITLPTLHSRVWHSYWFRYKWISEYIRIKKTTQTNIRIYSYKKKRYEYDTNEYSYWKFVLKMIRIFEYSNIRHTLT